MPNHVKCDLIISGNVDNIKNMLAQLVHPTEATIFIDANKIIPYPLKYKKADEKKILEEAEAVKDGYNNGGYEWCCEHWGTKWGMYDFWGLLLRKRSVKLSFLTAWSPPLPLILKMSEMFPEFSFDLKYYEKGVGFQGRLKCKAGQTIIEYEVIKVPEEGEL